MCGAFHIFTPQNGSFHDLVPYIPGRGCEKEIMKKRYEHHDFTIENGIFHKFTCDKKNLPITQELQIMISRQFSADLTFSHMKNLYFTCHKNLIVHPALPQDTILDKHCDPRDCSRYVSESQLQSFPSVTSCSLSRVPIPRRGHCSLGTPSKQSFSASSALLLQVAGGTKWR